MKIDTPARLIGAGAILTALALLFQTAPVLIPGIGLAISLLATLPVALAAVLSIPFGAIVYLASSFLILLISPQEAAVFLLATGLLGLTLGIGHKKRLLHAFAISAAPLFVGLAALSRLALIPVFGSATPHAPLMQILLFLLLAPLYTVLWMIIVQFATDTLASTKNGLPDSAGEGKKETTRILEIYNAVSSIIREAVRKTISFLKQAGEKSEIRQLLSKKKEQVVIRDRHFKE
jgi:hypothetical protein